MLSALSLFSGMGGLDLGAHLAGIRVAAAVDADTAALEVLVKAMGTKTILGYTQDLAPEDVIASAGLQADGAAILIGGPPCTAFSHAGFWLERKRDGSDSQAARIEDYWRYVQALRPSAFGMENVPGLAFENHEIVLQHFINRARKNGYSVAAKILDAADYGVPQARRRLFVVGLKSRQRFVFPAGTFVNDRRGSKWAFEGLTQATNPAEVDECLTGKYAKLLPLVPDGDNYLFFTKRRGYEDPQFEWRKRYWSFLLKLHPERPSPTIAATRVSNNGPFHWRNRRLRVRELTRLQSFPDSYPLATIDLARRHLGNAVPPLLAGQLLWSIRMALGEVKSHDFPDALANALEPRATASEVMKALAVALPKRPPSNALARAG
jgi:DNA (cytosine-5)-methyltransferase 1